MSIVTQILFWLVVWFLVSIPLAILAGQLLRRARKAQTRRNDELGSNHRAQRRRFIAAADPPSYLRRAKKRRVLAAR
jgi:hypothetical protein